jgi:enoyl-CoA hydratase
MMAEDPQAIRSTQASVSEAEGVITVTFTRSEKRNAISREIFAVLGYAAKALAERDDLRVLLITAEGPYFTAGFDINDMRTSTLGESSDGVIRGSNMRYQYRAAAHHDFNDELEQIEKPIILAAQGHCMGFGVEMGSSCDFRLASDAARFGLPDWSGPTGPNGWSWPVRPSTPSKRWPWGGSTPCTRPTNSLSGPGSSP